MKEFKPPFCYLVIDNPFQFDIKEIREYREKIKSQKYISHIPRGLLKFYLEEKWIKKLSNASGLPEDLIRTTNSARSGVHGIWSGNPHIFGPNNPKNPNYGGPSPNISGPVSSSSGFNGNCRDMTHPRFPSPKVAVGAMVGKPSEWFTKPYIERMEEEGKLKGKIITAPRSCHELAEKLIEEAQEGKIDKVLINIPPRHGKYRGDR